MKDKKSALGKGLDALIPIADSINCRSTTSSQSDSFAEISHSGMAGVTEIPIEDISPNPYQPRLTFDDEALSEMAESIRSLGLIQPLTVRRIGSKYQIVSGERRFRASKLAGLSTVPAYVITTDDKGMLEMAIVENIQRENLNAIEVALGYRRLMEECRLTQEEMAGRIGKKRTSITNFLRLLKLPPSIQSAIAKGLISVGHAKCLLSLDDEIAEIRLCDETITNSWSVRQLEEKVQSILNKRSGKESNHKNTRPLTLVQTGVISAISRYFNGKVTLKNTDDGKGSITIHFENDGELETFLDALQPEA